MSLYPSMNILVFYLLSLSPLRPHSAVGEKTESEIGFLFSFEAKKKLVAATFMSALDYGDVIFIHVSCHIATRSGHGAHHSFETIYTSLFVVAHVRLKHSQVIIYKSILSPLPSYRQTYTKQKVTVSVPRIFSTCLFQRKTAFRYVAPSAWNELHKDLKLKGLVTLDVVKMM